jgi:cellulose biosynthesis protein BcsQ
MARTQLLADVAAQGLLSGVGQLDSSEQPALTARLRRLFAELRQVFAFVVVDYPSPLDLFWQAVYYGVDGCVVPVKSDYLSVKSAMAHWAGPADDKLAAVLPTFVRRHQVLTEQTLEELSRHFGKERVSRPVPASVRVAEAPAAGGLTIFEYAPGSTPARAYWSLVERIYDGRI